ncbi:MAG: phosphoenolpyruvate--protein phosphotransferase [Planctomycetota bacterium]
MELKKGIPAAPGVVIGQAFVLDAEELRIPQRFIEREQVEMEVARFEAALRAAHRSLDREIARVGEKIEVGAQILSIHKQLLGDPLLQSEVITGIREHQYTAEHAVSRVLNRYITRFKGADSPMIAERVHDLYDIERLILSTLLGSRLETLHTLEQEVVLVARNLTPAQAAALDSRFVKGFATDVGGKTSHTAIMARALGIPAVLALGDISTSVVGGDTLIIDGFRGVVVIDPDERTLSQYRARVSDVERMTRRLRKQAILPGETIDGYTIDLLANIELPQEVALAVELGATGIGLFRTEFIHMQMPRPDEELHFVNYMNVIKDLGNRPLTIRTLDLGGDKVIEGQPAEENPFLGCRSIRYCLAHPEVFRAQLRAILRASAHGQIFMMLPMVGSLREIEQSVALVAELKAELRRESVPFDENLPIGVMVEVPSVAVTADLFASRVAFFSVGTNDLVQFALAVDRGNQQVASMYDPVHPGILRLLVKTLEAGAQAGIPVSLCGEMAAEPLYIPLLIGLGLRKLSVAPHLIPEVKQVVRAIQVHDARKLARECLRLPDSQLISEELRAWGRKYLPEIGYDWSR